MRILTRTDGANVHRGVEAPGLFFLLRRSFPGQRKGNLFRLSTDLSRVNFDFFGLATTFSLRPRFFQFGAYWFFLCKPVQTVTFFLSTQTFSEWTSILAAIYWGSTVISMALRLFFPCQWRVNGDFFSTERYLFPAWRLLFWANCNWRRLSGSTAISSGLDATFFLCQRQLLSAQRILFLVQRRFILALRLLFSYQWRVFPSPCLSTATFLG